MSSQDKLDFTDLVVAELGRLSLLAEAAQASNLLLQIQIDILKERVGTLEGDQALMKLELLVQGGGAQSF